MNNEVKKRITFKGVPIVFRGIPKSDDSVYLLPSLPEGTSPGLAHLYEWLTRECALKTLPLQTRKRHL